MRIFALSTYLTPLLLSVVLCQVSFAKEAILDQSTSELSVTHFSQLFADTEGNLSFDKVSELDEAKFEVIKTRKLTLDPTQAPNYWLQLKLNQEISDLNGIGKEWWLEFIEQSENDIEVYAAAPGEGYHQIYRKETNQKKLDAALSGRKFQSQVFAVNLFNQFDKPVYIKISPKTHTKIALSLWNPSYIENTENQYLSAIGVFYGVILLLLLLNIFLNISVGDINYFFYILYLTAVATFMLSLSGLDNLQLWSFLPELTLKIALSSGAGALLWANLFVVSFLETRQFAPKLSGILMAMLPINLILAFSPFIFAPETTGPYVIAATAILYTLSIIAVIRNWQVKGNHPARLYFFSWLTLPVGLGMYTLNSYDLIPFQVLGHFSLHIAFAVHLFLLSLGLIDRTQADKKLKYIELGKQHQAIVASRKAEDEMLTRALHDGLTGLPNRVALQKRMPEIIREAEIYQQSIAIILINLSHFHEINNTLGHQNGDELLKLVTARLSEISSNLENSTIIDIDSSQQSVASIEGVTYGMVLLVDTQQQVEFAAKRVLSSMKKHFDFKKMSIDIGARLGVALYPEHGKDLNTLVRRALVAMENADKNATHLTMYSPDLDPYSPRRLALMGELSRAIDDDELVLYFQPQINIEQNAVVGVEALARWRHAEHGFIPPDEFIPLAEKTGLIRKLSRWVIDKALEQCAELIAQDIHISVSVNLSAQNLQEANFVTRIKSLLAKHKVPANFLTLELTETAMMLDPNQAQQVLMQLHSEGVRISIDDFGTGYSSLSYIKKLPLHEVKIDKSFVQDMVNDKDDTIIVNTTLHMSHNLGLRVVAEGVESADIMEALRGLGCDIAQGYYLTRPLDPNDLVPWLHASPYDVGDEQIKQSLESANKLELPKPADAIVS